MIEIRVDAAQALTALQRANIGGMRSRIESAVSRTLEDARAEATRRVNARFVRDYATPVMKVKASGLNGTLSATDRRHSLTSFIVNPSTRPPHNPPGGLHVKVRRADNERLPRAFIGRGQAFERVGRARTPLRRLTGPSGSQELGSKHIAPQLESRIARRIEQELNSVMEGLI